MKQKLTAEQKRFKLIEGPIAKQLVIFALPILLSNLLQQMYNTVDGIFVGRLVGSDALTGVTQSGKITMVLVSLFLGMGVGASVIVSQYFGAKDKENLSKAIHTAIISSVIFGIALTFIGIFGSGWLLRIMQVQPEHYEYALNYLQIYFAASVFVLMYNVLSGILRAVGDSLTPLLVLAFTAALNIGLDYIFIGVLKTGVKGAAWATFICQAISCALLLLKLSLSKQDYRVSLKKMRFDKAAFKKIMMLGIPAAIQNSVISVAHIVMQAFINNYDREIVNGVAQYSKLDGFLYLPINSFAMALSTFVAQNVGAGKYDRAKKSVWIAILMSQAVNLVLSTILFFTCKRLLYLLAPDASDTAIKYGMIFMRVMVLSYPILVVNDALAGALRGSGKAIVPAIILISAMCFLRILVIISFTPVFRHVLVVMLTYPISWSFSVTALLIYFFRSRALSPRKAPQSPEALGGKIAERS